LNLFENSPTKVFGKTSRCIGAITGKRLAMTKGIEISNMTSKTMNKEAKIEGFLNSLISEIKDRIIITSNVIHTFSCGRSKASFHRKIGQNTQNSLRERP